MSAPRFLAKMSLDTEVGAAFSDTRIRLLEEIDRKGSINQAAKAVPISYKAAWDAIDNLNNLGVEPLVVRSAGGRQGGGSQLTDYGRRIVAMYRALELEYQGALDRISSRFHEVGVGDVRAFQRLMHRMSMKSSARNQFSGPVVHVQPEGKAGVHHEVCIDLDGESQIVAVITRASAENLGVTLGRELFAMVKSSSVMLTTDRRLRLTARNQLWGVITELQEGPLNHEVTLTLPSGRTVTSVISASSCNMLGLDLGVEACAFFKASSVIVATCD